MTRDGAHSDFEVLPAPVCDLDLSLGNLATRLDEGVKEHEDVVRAAIQEPVMRVPKIWAEFAQLAVDLASAWVSELRTE